MAARPKGPVGKSSPRYRRRRPGPSGAVWLLAAIGLAIVVILVVKFALPRGNTGSSLDGQPVAADVLTALTTVPTAVFDAAGTGGATVAAGGVSTLWKGSAGKPVFLYVGAEYCPYCAATRWSLVTALARFGTWSGLQYHSSSAQDAYPSTPTFTFLHASYTSSYFDFQSAEEQGQLGKALQHLTAQQSKYRDTYEAPPYLPQNKAGGYPFLDVANRFLWSGSIYDPGALTGQQWAGIAQGVHAGQGPAAQYILAGANRVSAAICAVDGDQPAAVCGSAAIKAAIAKLPAAQGTGA